MQPQTNIDAAEIAAVDIAPPARAVAGRRRSPWLRALRKVLVGMITQYIIIGAAVGVSLAVTLHYYVTPQIVAQYEAIAKALRR
jgi:hypothetical protein